MKCNGKSECVDGMDEEGCDPPAPFTSATYPDTDTNTNKILKIKMRYELFLTLLNLRPASIGICYTSTHATIHTVKCT